MDERRVFIVGKSIFSETLGQLLAGTKNVSVVGTAPTVEEAMLVLHTDSVDAVITTIDADETAGDEVCRLLARYPNLPLIRINLTSNTVQIITSRQVDARRSDLLAVIANLPVLKTKLEEE